jgi:hypothetical protein
MRLVLVQLGPCNLVGNRASKNTYLMGRGETNKHGRSTISNETLGGGGKLIFKQRRGLYICLSMPGRCLSMSYRNIILQPSVQIFYLDRRGSIDHTCVGKYAWCYWISAQKYILTCIERHVSEVAFQGQRIWNSVLRFELFTAVTMKNAVFWDIKPQFVPHRRHITSPPQSPAG